MRFIANQSQIIGPLQSVARSCGVRSSLPVLSNLLLKAASGVLELSATNLEIGVVKRVKVEIEEEGELTVPAKTLVELIGNLGSEKLVFEGNNDQLRVSNDNFSSQINGVGASEFPVIPLSGSLIGVVDPKSLSNSLPEVVFAAAIDEGRPVLTGILTEFKGKKLDLVATDGYRLAHKALEIKEDISFKALIPRRTFEEIGRLISEDQVDGLEILISDDKNQIIFNFGNTTLSSRLIEGQFPNWEKIIPSEFKARVIVEKESFLKAVKLASIFARNEANIVSLKNLPQKIVLTSEAKELGGQTKEVVAEVEGEEIEIAFNTKFLADCLGVIHTSQIIIELSGNLSAAMIKPMGQEGLEYIIMPVNRS